MFLPPGIEELFNQFASKTTEPAGLNQKIKALLGVACSVMADCIPCLTGYYTKALESGASKEEIAEALAMAMAVSAGSKRAKYAELIDSLGNQ